jgi:hypothetical protein
VALEEEREMRQKVLSKNPEYMQRRVRQIDVCLADLAAIEIAYRNKWEEETDDA